jgi:ABC-type transporter Mla maintaining outer membrane lipid asymmetry ATPase subunit MlaF
VTNVLLIAQVQKNYSSLRPLRLRELTIAPGERVAISGLDAGAAEVLVNLVTGASLPDQGEVRVMGRPTADIANGDEWLASLDRFGIISARGVLLEAASIEQNIAMVFTLMIDPVPPETAARVGALAAECGISDVAAVTGETPPEIRARIHLARAVALEPGLLIIEHPTAGIPEEAREPFAKDLAAVTAARRLAALVITQDEAFARIAADRVLRLDGATGVLKPARRGWFSR